MTLERAQVAHRPYRCGGVRQDCPGLILPGERYSLVMVCPEGGDDSLAIRECARCASARGR